MVGLCGKVELYCRWGLAEGNRPLVAGPWGYVLALPVHHELAITSSIAPVSVLLLKDMRPSDLTV